jgi:hypothetical protein
MSERIQQMRLNSKLTWGLAWAGLAVVLVVPSADYLTGVLGKGKTTTALLTSTTDPVKAGAVKVGAKPTGDVTKTASVTTKVTKNGVSIVPNTTAASTQIAANSTGAPVLDPVDKLVKSGKKLPDYISGGDDTTTTGSIPATTKTPATTTQTSTTQVATIDPQATAVPPKPFPHRPPDVAHAALPKPVQSTQPAVIVDEQALATQEATAMPDQLAVGDDAGPLPPAGIPDDWRTIRQRKLMKYLEQNGLVDGASADGRSSASVTIIQRPSPDYDPDGFYLSEGPNGAKAARRARIERMLEDQDDDSSFTLF